MCPVAGIDVTVLVIIALQILQCTDFDPAFVHVGAVSVTYFVASYVCPFAAIASSYA